VALAFEPSSWLDIARGALHVPPPGQDGWCYTVPRVGIVEDAPSWLGDSGPVLVWDFDDEDRPPVDPNGRILDEFVRLPLVPEARFAAEVLEFASKYGPLGLCRHGKPRWHPPGCVIVSPAYGWHGWSNLEPIAIWRRYARHMRALLMIAAQLQTGGQGSDEHWDAVIAVNPRPVNRPEIPAPDVSVEEWLTYERAYRDFDARRADFGDARAYPPDERPLMERYLIADAARTWLRYGKVELESNWRPDELYARSCFKVWELAAVLAVFFQSAIQGPLYVCAGCGSASRLDDERERRPRRGTKFWCGLCGRAAQKRLADRRRYLRRKGLSVVADSQTSREGASATE
jgi:hypothetical protein